MAKDTGNTAVLSDEELIGLIDRKLRSRGITPGQFARLQSRRDRLIKAKVNDDLLSEFDEPQRRVLRELEGEKRQCWEKVFRTENRQRLEAKAKQAKSCS